MSHPPSSIASDLDASLTLRPVRWDDLAAVTRCIYACCEAFGDVSLAYTEEDLANEWKYAGFDPQQDAFVVETRSGQLAGYGALYDVSDHSDLNGDTYVHPQFEGQGVDGALLRALESRARQHIALAPPAARVFMHATLDNQDEAGKAVFASLGHSPVRYHWRMSIDLAAAPSVPALPPGLELRPFVQEQHAQAVWQARNEAFAHHWGSHPMSFEEFCHFYFDSAEFDPSLWQVIWSGAEVVGFSINHQRLGDVGWVRTLGVRPAWRGQGIGLALLYRSFDAFYQRGLKSIGLAVDASNETGATRLYRKAGMQVMKEFVTFEKELRPAGAAAP